MPYLGHKPLSETAPNHPFARSQISFGVRRPDSLKTPSRTETVSEEIKPQVKSTREKAEEMAKAFGF